MAYPKLGFTSDEREAFVRDLLTHAVVVDPSLTLDVVQDDPADNRVLECGVESGADWIVSGDSDVLELGTFKNIRILRASEAEEMITRGE